MSDWQDSFNEEEREAWDEFVAHFRRDGLQKISEADLFISIVPEHGWDVKFALELGAAIMCNKPIIAVVMEGAEVPPKLAMIADDIVSADLDTEEGRKAIAVTLKRHVERASE